MWLIGGDGRLYGSLVSTARNTPIYQYPNFNASVFCATLGTIIVCGRLVCAVTKWSDQPLQGKTMLQHKVVNDLPGPVFTKVLVKLGASRGVSKSHHFNNVSLRILDL